MIILILLLIFHTVNMPVYAVDNSTTYYARVMFEQVYLYKSPTDNDDVSNIYFEIPKTYFVELTGKSGNFFEARYMNFVGYVKKDSVQATSSIPINPYLNNVNFRVYAELSENLWSLPSTQINSTLITQIPTLTKNIQYIGKITGECLIENRTNVWFYCKYTTDKDYYGYVYSDFCDEMPAIANNTEKVDYINNPTFEVNPTQTKTIPINNNYVGVIIGILSVPALIFVFMIIKGTKILSRERPHGKEVVDY